MEPEANTIPQMSVLIPLISAIVGGVIAIAGQLVVYWIKECPKRKLDVRRKELLSSMLQPEHMPNGAQWRDIETLSRVVGATEEETKRLLIEIGARGGSLENDVWALIKHKPLPTKQGEE